MKALVIVVRGTRAEPAGSKTANRHGGVRDANKNAKPWKAIVADKAESAVGKQFGRHFDGGLTVPSYVEVNLPVWPDAALVLDVVEYRARPKGHFTTKGALSATGKRKPHPTSIPDRGKILRGIEDALIGLVYRDDAQIVDGRVAKRWSTSARTVIIVAPVDDREAMLERFETLQALAMQESEQRQEEAPAR